MDGVPCTTQLYSDIVKRLKELKKLVDTDPQIKQLLDSFSVAKENYEKDSSLISELTKSKTALYNHPIVSEYRKLYSDMNLSFIKFSKELSSLIKVKNPTCSRI
jgi:cell fate (sporulation/competence/biofilm development) regulator YlbF (YheA/YmcA/DUF963 family)